jgi:hypothetical protein
MASSLSRLANSKFRQNCKTQNEELGKASLEKSPMAQHPYKISLISVQPFSNYKFVRRTSPLKGVDLVELGWVWVGWVRLLTSTRRRSCARAWLMASSLSHLTNSKFRQDGITQNKVLEKASLEK